jgi:MFS family permease
MECLNEKGEYYTCLQPEACSDQNKATFKVITDGRFTLNNWMNNLNLICNPRYEIGLQGTCLFIGQTLGAVFLTHWSDIYGRKMAVLIHGAGYACIIIASTFAQSLLQTYIFIFCIGLLFVPRSAALFTYIMEITPDKYHADANLWVYIGDGSTFVISGIFTLYTRDVYMFLTLMSSVAIASCAILLYFLPESPKFQFAKVDYEGLRANFEQIKRMNSVDDANVDEMIAQLKEAKANYVDH